MTAKKTEAAAKTTAAKTEAKAKAAAQPGVWPGRTRVIYLGPNIPARVGGPLTKNTVLKLDKTGRVAFAPVRELMAKFPALARLAAPPLDAPRIKRGLREDGSAQAQALADLKEALAEAMGRNKR